MEGSSASQHGFLAVSYADGADHRTDLARALTRVGAPANLPVRNGSMHSMAWGLPAGAGVNGFTLLCHAARRRDTDLSDGAIQDLLRGPDLDGLRQVLPTFAAAHIEGDSMVAAADALGFRHLYVTQTPEFAALSTSSRVLGAMSDSSLDRKAWAVQSLLGWQLGQRSVLQGVRKLAPASLVELRNGTLALTSFAAATDCTHRDPDDAVDEAAAFLRDYLDAFLDDHPDAILQLTGGQDSRLLLSGIRPDSRRGLRAVTLGLPGNPDVVIAADLARRYGLVHEVLTLAGLEELPPNFAYRLCVEAAQRLECMADPLAHAALTFAEARSQPGPRLSGLGGEVARGFYYVGRGGGVAVTRRRIERLARWRMFANESVPAEALDPDFAAWAREAALDELEGLMSSSGRAWLEATDDLYLGQRMQRWAGVTDTAVCFDRLVANPMLDDRFVSVATSLSPRHKRGSLFLSRLQVALDDELARLPLDGRPAPAAFATRSVANSARQVSTTAGKAVTKARQRASRTNRPPAGGDVLARKVVQHWQTEPHLLDDLVDLGVVRPSWLLSMLREDAQATPSVVALIINLTVASRSGHA
jgi:asparagine synthase (glutamine-hydrolysing)